MVDRILECGLSECRKKIAWSRWLTSKKRGVDKRNEKKREKAWGELLKTQIGLPLRC